MIDERNASQRMCDLMIKMADMGTMSRLDLAVVIAELIPDVMEMEARLAVAEKAIKDFEDRLHDVEFGDGGSNDD